MTTAPTTKRYQGESVLFILPEIQDGSEAIRAVKTRDAIAAIDREGIVSELEAIAHDRRTLARLADNAKALEAALRGALLSQLGDGEAELSPDGARVYFRGRVSAGRATVNEDALRDHAGELPPDLRPRMVEHLPNVTALRQAVKERAIPRRMLDVLIIEPPLVPGLKVRKIEDAGDE